MTEFLENPQLWPRQGGLERDERLPVQKSNYWRYQLPAARGRGWNKGGAGHVAPADPGR